MSAGRNANLKRNKEPLIANNAMADCVFPEEIMLCILTRLPVKSILRFKSVCKPWHMLFSTREFKNAHQGQFSSDPKNQSIILHDVHTSTMCLLNIDSNENQKPTIVDRPLPEKFYSMDLVGCCNGLLCLGSPQSLGPGVDLWNPALKLHKSVDFSGADLGGDPMIVSLGFGYDADGDDFKVVRIVGVEDEGGEEDICMNIGGFEVYSVNSESWTTSKEHLRFGLMGNKSDVTVNGNPYWLVLVDGNEGVDWALMCFDVKKLAFESVPMPEFYFTWEDGSTFYVGKGVEFVDWKGALGALVCRNDKEMGASLLDVWVFDDVERIWRIDHTSVRPIPGNVDRVFHFCSKNGRVLGKRPDGKVFVFDLANGCVEEIVIDEDRNHSFAIYGYTESLTLVKGMIKEVERN